MKHFDLNNSKKFRKEVYIQTLGSISGMHDIKKQTYGRF